MRIEGFGGMSGDGECGDGVGVVVVCSFGWSGGGGSGRWSDSVLVWYPLLCSAYIHRRTHTLTAHSGFSHKLRFACT